MKLVLLVVSGVRLGRLTCAVGRVWDNRAVGARGGGAVEARGGGGAVGARDSPDVSIRLLFLYFSLTVLRLWLKRPRRGVALAGMAVLGFLTVPAGPARTESEGSHSYTISFS